MAPQNYCAYDQGMKLPLTLLQRLWKTCCPARLLTRPAKSIFQLLLHPRFFLIGNPWAAVRNINLPAFPKTAALQQMLHDRIAIMGINPDICCLCFTKRKAAAQHAFLFPAAGNSVNRSIRLIVQPPSVFDSLISRIIATDKCKHTGNFRLIFCSPLLFDHITVSVLL